jgi:hypothetical protein
LKSLIEISKLFFIIVNKSLQYKPNNNFAGTDTSMSFKLVLFTCLHILQTILSFKQFGTHPIESIIKFINYSIIHQLE